MILRTLVVPDRYLDSVFLMGMAGKLRRLPGIADASAVMGTEANKGLLRETGLLDAQAEATRATDIVISLRAASEEAVEAARQALQELIDTMAAPRGAGLPGGAALGAGADGRSAPTSQEEALAQRPEATVAVISLPGGFVRREALKSLELGLHPFIFSDNVPLADEVELKSKGRDKGLLVMGPDCGTSILNGIALGFANAVCRGPVGIVGASGTGIQEVCCLLDRQGIGIHQAIGVGGRDLSQQVGGSSMIQAMDILDDDPACQVIVLISKPPHPRVAERVLGRAAACRTPCLVCFLGGDPQAVLGRGLPFAPRLDLAAARVAALLGAQDPALAESEPLLPPALAQAAEEQAAELAPGRRYLRALYSGGTLCEEAMLVARAPLGNFLTNLEQEGEHALGQDDRRPGHLFLDLGDDRYTRGRPHPMIDFTLRQQRLLDEAADPSTAVILFDLVCGYGAHPDPAAELARTIESLPREPGAPLFVASVTATEQDPQPYAAQRQRLEEAGVLVLDCNAAAASFAAAIAAAACRREER